MKGRGKGREGEGGRRAGRPRAAPRPSGASPPSSRGAIARRTRALEPFSLWDHLALLPARGLGLGAAPRAPGRAAAAS